MHPQLAAVVAELDDATRRLHRLADAAGDDGWLRRPGPDAWSAAECVAHLNVTSRAFLPRLERVLAEGRAAAAGAPPHTGRLRRTPAGWLVWRALVAPPRFSRSRTTPSFAPPGDGAMLARAALVREFDTLQASLVALVGAADGLPLRRLRVASPFAEWMRYDPYSTFTILAAHEHRHLGQAERAAGVAGVTAAGRR